MLNPPINHCQIQSQSKMSNHISSEDVHESDQENSSLSNNNEPNEEDEAWDLYLQQEEKL